MFIYASICCCRVLCQIRSPSGVLLVPLLLRGSLVPDSSSTTSSGRKCRTNKWQMLTEALQSRCVPCISFYTLQNEHTHKPCVIEGMYVMRRTSPGLLISKSSDHQGPNICGQILLSATVNKCFWIHNLIQAHIITCKISLVSPNILHRSLCWPFLASHS